MKALRNLFKNDSHSNEISKSMILASSLLQLPTNPTSIKSLEYRVFSQFGDDGIIHYLASKVQVTRQTFIEFGVENYVESNTRLLLQRDNWSGLIVDGSKRNIEQVKAWKEFWKYGLTAVPKFVTTENINGIFREAGFEGEIGLLSIDIDGCDYWIWEAIDCVDPQIVVCEYNSIFGSNACVTVPYAADFVRCKAHYSNLYAGASLGALVHLATQKGLNFVGCNSAGNNAYFVKPDLQISLPTLSVSEGFVECKFREARDSRGRLLLRHARDCRHLIAQLPVIDVLNGDTIKIEDI